MKKLVLIASILLVGCASDDSKKIPVCAMNITEPGLHVLDRNIDSSTCAIGIFSSNVQLNLNGHTLTGPGSHLSESFGVYGKGVSNIEIFNGKVQKFTYGIHIGDPSFGGGSVSNVKIYDVEVSQAGYMGISAEGSGIVVTNTRVTDVRGGSFHPLGYVYGINLAGRGCLVANNHVSEVYPDVQIAEGVAISLKNNNHGCVIQDNVMVNATPVMTKNTFGVWIDVYSTVVMKSNSITGFHYSGVVPNFTLELGTNTVDVPIIHAILDR